MSGSPTRPEAALRRLEWTSLRRLDGLLQGDYRTLFRGSGLDLADLREYQYGDDSRRIDWQATARLGTPHVRDDLEDREVAAWFVLDLSPSIDFGSGALTKRDALVALTGVLGRVLMRHGNRVGAICSDGAARRVLPARSSRNHLLQVLREAQRLHAPDATPGVTDLGGLLRSAAGVIGRRSIVLVVSDFISTPGWEPALARLAQRHDVVAVRLFDPLEQALPDIGLVPMRDGETGDWLMVDTHDAALRARYAQLAEAAELRLREALAQAGVDAMELACDDDVAQCLFGFMQMRKQRNRLAAGAASAAQSALTAGGKRAFPVA